MTKLFQILNQKNPNIKELKILLENGANIDEKDNRGRTPFHYASWNGHLEIVKLLNNYKIRVLYL